MFLNCVIFPSICICCMAQPAETALHDIQICRTSCHPSLLSFFSNKYQRFKPHRACRPSRSEFSVVFSETLVNMGQDPLERPPRRASHPQAQIPSVINGLNTNNNQQPPSHPFQVTKCFMSKAVKISEKFQSFRFPGIIQHRISQTRHQNRILIEQLTNITN